MNWLSCVLLFTTAALVPGCDTSTDSSNDSALNQASSSVGSESTATTSDAATEDPERGPGTQEDAGADGNGPEAEDSSASADASSMTDDGAQGPAPEDVLPQDPCSSDAPGTTLTVELSLGETLFPAADDYLSTWSDLTACDMPLELIQMPENANATLLPNEDGTFRLTPDKAGLWVLVKGQHRAEITVETDGLYADEFLNYNYTPTHPMVHLTRPDGTEEIWVVSPPSNAVQRVLVDNGEASADVLVPTGSWPTAIAYWQPDEGPEYLLITQTGRDTLGFLDLETQRLVDAIHVGNEPASVVVDSDASPPTAYVTLSGEDRVAKINLLERRVTDTVLVGRDPRAMVFVPSQGRLYVASLVSQNLHPQGPVQDSWLTEESQKDIAIIDLDTFSVTAYIHEVGTILRGLFIDEQQPDTLWVAASHSNNLSASVDADTKPHSHRLIKVDVKPDSSSSNQVVDEVDLDEQPSSLGPAASPYTMAKTMDGTRLLVTLSAGTAILSLDAQTKEELERIPCGSDPRGLVFTEGHVWTYAWLDNQLQGWKIEADGSFGSEVSPVAIGADPTPLEVKQGQRMFNNASFSRHGDFSCNNCHIDGLTDGLVWDLLTDGSVNTIAFRNVGGTSPFLWGGQLPTLFDFSREVLKLVGAEASGTQMHLITTYMQSVTAPPNPFTRAGGKLTAAAEWGRDIFQRSTSEPGGAGCNSCHSGPLLTNRQMTMGKTAGVMTDVPSLFGVYDTAPYGRRGQWETLEYMIDFALAFTGAELSDAETDALVAYVREQPGQTLYLNSSKPMNHSRHVWHQTPIELTYSSILKSGQEHLFKLVQLVDPPSVVTEDTLLEGVEIPGTWSISGRFVRFEPDDALALNTAYTVYVESSLEGKLGHAFVAPMFIEFETGGLPAFDVSGTWRIDLCEPNFGCVDVEAGLLQTPGGKVTGVILDTFEEGSLDHLEGVVDDEVLALDPFYIESTFGTVFIENGIICDLKDEDGDGFAESGFGLNTLEILGFVANVEFYLERIGFPDE